MGRMPTRLLVLEDDDGIRTALRLSMEDEGYEVSEHADAEGALRLVRDVGPGPDAGRPDARRHGRLLVHPRGAADQPGPDHRAQRPVPTPTTSWRRSRPVPTTTSPSRSRSRRSAPRLRALRRRTAGRTRAEPCRAARAAGPGPARAACWCWTPRRARSVAGEAEVHLTAHRVPAALRAGRRRGPGAEPARLLERVWDRGYFGDERIVDVHVAAAATKIERGRRQPASCRHRARPGIPARPAVRAPSAAVRPAGRPSRCRSPLGALVLSHGARVGTYLAAAPLPHRPARAHRREPGHADAAYVRGRAADAGSVGDATCSARSPRRPGPRSSCNGGASWYSSVLGEGARRPSPAAVADVAVGRRRWPGPRPPTEPAVVVGVPLPAVGARVLRDRPG